MDSYARQNADRLVSRLVSESASGRASLLAQEDPSSWDSVRLEAFREALRTARLSGRLNDAAYDQARAQIERWYRNASASNTADLPTVLLDTDEATEELDVLSHTLRRVEPAIEAPSAAAEPQPAIKSERRVPQPEPPVHAEARRADPLSSTVSVTVQVHRPPTETLVHEVRTPTSPGTTQVFEARTGNSMGAPNLMEAARARSNGAAVNAAAPERTQEATRDVPAVASTAAGVAESAEPKFRPGETIRSRYLLEEQTGAGGSSYIFRTRDLRRDAVFDRDAFVALKVPREHLRDRSDIAERLKREFNQTQALVHPNIVRVLDIDCEHGTWFMTMEMLDGEALSTLLACLHPQVLPQDEALAILRGCGEALAFAHGHGVLHCDVKPGNIFVTRREEVRVLDFGVAGPSPAARQGGPRSTRVTAATPCYASPDILEGSPPEECDDVFSFACVAYEVLTGRHPFDRHSTLDARDRGMRLRRLPGLSRRQFATLERALAWNRKRRTATVSEVLAGLGVVKSHSASMSWLKAGAALAAGAVLAAILFNMQSNSDRAPASVAQTVPSASTARSEASGRVPAAEAGRAPAGGNRAASPRDATDARSGSPATRGPAPVLGSRADPGAYGTRTSPPTPVRSHPLARAPMAGASPAPGPQATAAVGGTARTTPGPRRISLEQTRIVVSEGAVSAVVRVRRLDDLTGRVRIQWRAIPGSAQPGSDYSMDGLGTIAIPEGQDVRVLFIPILNDEAREPNESFDVEIFGLTGRGQLEPITRATVTILDND